MEKKVVVILSITSDIGADLAKRYTKKGNIVIGTYRSEKGLEELKKIPNCHLFFCDVINKESIEEFIKNFECLNIKWDILISCVGTQKPIGKFFNCDFEEWSSSIHVNAIEPLRVLHRLYLYRNKEKFSKVIFFAGGGSANKATESYSAYGISKIMLTKLCELFDFENKDIIFSILGPGWTKTKMHYETINEKRENVGENYERTVEFMEKGVGTSMEDIFNCVEWVCEQDKEIVGGRNFSVVYDKWKKDSSETLKKVLKEDINMYKLRRFKNDFI